MTQRRRNTGSANSAATTPRLMADGTTPAANHLRLLRKGSAPGPKATLAAQARLGSASKRVQARPGSAPR